MPVDKAYEKQLNAYEYKAAEDYASTKPLDMREYALGIYLGYQAGQKSLSPEVRDVLEAIAKPERVLSVTGITYLRCQFCHKTGAIGESIEHENFCTVPKIEKILAKE
jgi:hypothetical protein